MRCEIFQRNGEVVTREAAKNLAGAFQLLISLPDDFFSEGRGDTLSQMRDSFFRVENWVDL